MSDDSNYVNEMIQEETELAKEKILKGIHSLIHAQIENKFMKALGIKRVSSWGNEYNLIAGGYLDEKMQETVNTSEHLKELKDGLDECFKYSPFATPTQLKELKNDVRHTLRRKAIGEVKKETIDKLQNSVTNYVRTVVEDDKGIADMLDIYNISEL